MKYRNLKVMLISLFMLFVYPSAMLAHSSLVSTVPNEISNSKVTEITMNFNEDLESATKVKVTNVAGEEQALKGTKTNDKVLTVILEEPLTDGVYTVDWRIISADGHPGKGNFSFEVKLPVVTPTTESSAANSKSSHPAPSVSPSVQPTEPSATATPATTAQTSQSSTSSSNIDLSKWALVAAVFILIIAVVLSLLKKRRS